MRIEYPKPPGDARRYEPNFKIMTEFRVTFLENYNDIHSGKTLVFHKLQDAMNFVFPKKFWVESLIEHRSFEPRLYCWPEGVERNAIVMTKL